MKIEYEPDGFSLLAFVILVIAICATFVATHQVTFKDNFSKISPRSEVKNVRVEIHVKPVLEPVSVPLRFQVAAIPPVELAVEPRMASPAALNLKTALKLQVQPEIQPGALSVPIRVRVNRIQGQPDGDLLPPPKDVKAKR